MDLLHEGGGTIRIIQHQKPTEPQRAFNSASITHIQNLMTDYDLNLTRRHGDTQFFLNHFNIPSCSTQTHTHTHTNTLSQAGSPSTARHMHEKARALFYGAPTWMEGPRKGVLDFLFSTHWHEGRQSKTSVYCLFTFSLFGLSFQQMRSMVGAACVWRNPYHTLDTQGEGEEGEKVHYSSQRSIPRAKSRNGKRKGKIGEHGDLGVQHAPAEALFGSG